MVTLPKPIPPARRADAPRPGAVASAGFRPLPAAIVAALALGMPGVASAWDFTPRVALAQTWIDNVDLAPKGLEESDRVTELKPGFLLALDRPRARLLLDYELEALWFGDNSDLDDVYHQATGRGNFVLAPETLFLDAAVRYDQQEVDPAGRVAYSNLFRSDNRADVLVVDASPYHRGRWGAWGESLLRYQYRGVRYGNVDEGVTLRLQDADTHGLSASLGSPEARRGVSWRASGSTSRTEFDEAPEFRYSRAALDLGAPLGLRTRATATVGRESDVAVDRTDGGLDSTFWFVGLEWEPSELQSVTARVGERYYGTAYDFRWARRGSRGELGLTYAEEATTSAGVLGDEGVFLPGYRPGGVPRLDTRVFLHKRLAGNASYEFARSRLGARLYSDRRSYEEDERETDKSHGATVSFDWDFAARTRLGLAADWERRELSGGDRTDDYGQFTLRLSRELSRVLTGTLRYSHFLRNSDVNEDYRVDLVSLSLLAVF